MRKNLPEHVVPGRSAMAMRGVMLAAVTALTVVGVSLPRAVVAAGYLTPLGQGIEVTSYMVNNGVHGGGSVGLTLWVSGISNPDSCGSIDKVHIKRTTVNYSEMVAAVISAITSGRKIGFHSTGCETIPFWGGTTTYPIVSDLWIVP